MMGEKGEADTWTLTFKMVAAWSKLVSTLTHYCCPRAHTARCTGTAFLATKAMVISFHVCSVTLRPPHHTHARESSPRRTRASTLDYVPASHDGPALI